VHIPLAELQPALPGIDKYCSSQIDISNSSN
jgi:hypothetical protein